METVFPGIRAMENLHPVFVHFPIGLLLGALVVQVLAVVPKLRDRREEWQRVALWLLWLGTLGALAAAGTGLLAAENVQVPDPAIAVVELHQYLMLTVTGLAVALSLLALVRRRRLTRGVQLLLLGGLLVLGGVLAVGADRGGQLVYQYGVSVKAAGEGR